MSAPQVRFIDTPTQVLTSRLFDNHIRNINYRGITVDATPAEIFIDGVDDYRLQPPKNSVGHVRYRAIGQSNLTSGDTAHHISTGAFTFRRQASDNTLAFSGANAIGTPTGNPGVLAIVGTGSHVAFTINNPAGSDDDYFICTVTGNAGSVIWDVELDILVSSVPVGQLNRIAY